MTTPNIADTLKRYPWWSAARLAEVRTMGDKACAESRLIAQLHPTAVAERKSIDTEKMTHISADDLIDRFLQRTDYRIVAEEGDADDVSDVIFDDEDDIVSEELAEIYLNQGLYSEAIATYRKLSLLNSEKSIYFAELIAEIEKKIVK